MVRSVNAQGKLVVDGVTKTFGGVVALDSVSLVARSGEVVGLIGPNGAGKTTLVNVITRVTELDSGTVSLNGDRLDQLRAEQIPHLGIARTFQHIRLFGALTARQNVEVSLSVARRYRGVEPPHGALELLAEIGLEQVADREARTLPYGFQRRLEIARAMALVPEFLLLDEPAAGANEAESHELNEMIQGIRREARCGILVIDHDLRFIMNICDRLYVLDEGEVIAQGSPSDVQQDPKVIEGYLGRSESQSI